MRSRSYVPSRSMPVPDRRSERIAELETALEDERAYALKLQIALTGLSGGGSENFITHKGVPRADIPFCTQRIRERQDSIHQVATGFARRADVQKERADKAEARVAALEAEMVVLDEICGHYALDEARFLREEGEPFGSVPIEAGMKAREAGRRYAERERAELDGREAAARAVLTDPVESDDERHDAQLEIEIIGYTRARIAPLLPAPGGEAPKD